MTQRNLIGLGLDLPDTGSFYTSEGFSRRPHERSYSLNDPFHSRASSSTHGSIEYNRSPYSTYSGTQHLHSTQTTRVMAKLDAAAAAVVGTVPKTRQAELVFQSKNTRSCSNETVITQTDKDLNDPSVSHLKLARVRARSAPSTNLPEDSPSVAASVNIPRADSLLRLDSNTASTDLKRLLTTRVRHAPPIIDTKKANASGISSSSASPTKDGLRPSHLETEKSRPRVEVHLALNNHVAVEGGHISGTLTVRTRKPRRGEPRHVRIDAGKIRVLGFEGISEAERYAFYQCSVPLAEASVDCTKLCQSHSDDDGFSVARVGTFSLPFTMHIPCASRSQPRKNVPKGVIQDNSVNAAIKYILLISFKVKDDSDNAAGIDKHAKLANPKISIAHFYRGVELWPTYGPMALHSPEESHPGLGQAETVSSRTAQGLLFGGTGMLHLTAVLHRNVWLAGQKCMVYIGAWNETKKFVKTLTLSIVRKAAIARPNQSESINKKQIAEVTLDAVRGPSFGPVTGKGWWAGIEPGATCEFSHMIEIPADALTVLRTHMIEVSYVLRISLVTGSLSSNVSVDLPFNIINAISTDGLPVPPPPGLLVGGLKIPKDVPVSFAFNAQPKHNQGALDLRTWSFPTGHMSETCAPPQQDILEWTRRTSGNVSSSDVYVSPSQDYTHDTRSVQSGSQVSQDANTSHQFHDELTTEDTMSRLISQLESDLSTPEHLSSHCSGQRSSFSGSGILKAPSSAKHRVTFLTPTMSDVFREDKSLSMRGDFEQPDPNVHDGFSCSKGPSTRRFMLRDDSPVGVQPGELMPQRKETWNDDDADEILRSIHIQEDGFDPYHANQGQELGLNRKAPGPLTGSSLSWDSWSASGTTSSQPSAGYQQSTFETSPKQETGRSISYLYSQDATPGSQPSFMLKDDTPRAGSVPRFRPEIVTAPIRTSSSRATLIPSISIPMLAKSQSAHVVGSPVNQYRKFSPQQVFVAQLGSDNSRTTSTVRLSPEETRTMGAGRTPWKANWDRSTLRTSEAARRSVDLPPSSSNLTVVADTRSHLRSRSGPEQRNEPRGVDMTGTKAASQSTVRSRIAALEERSRSRPVSHCSSSSPTSSIFLQK